MQLDALALYLDFHEASRRFDFAAAKAAYDAMHAQWQAVYDENTDLVANEAPAYFRRFLEKFVTQAVTYSSAPYRLVYAIPGRAADGLRPPTAVGQPPRPAPAGDARPHGRDDSHLLLHLGRPGPRHHARHRHLVPHPLHPAEGTPPVSPSGSSSAASRTKRASGSTAAPSAPPAAASVCLSSST